MNVSKKLQEQLDNLKSKGFFRLEYPEKLELEKHIGYKLNKSCAVCLRNEMLKLIEKIEPRTPVIHFIGIK